SRLVVAVGVRRTEGRIGRRLRVGGQIEHHAGRRRGRGPAVAAGHLQVLQRSRIEAARGRRRVDLQVLALRVDDIAVVVGGEGARARVLRGAVIADGEETIAVQRQVETVARGADIALRELLLDLRELHAAADLGVADTRGGGREQLGKFRVGGFEAAGGRVGDVVRRDVQIALCGIEAAERYTK